MRWFFAALFLAHAFAASAASIPPLDGETLSGKRIAFPAVVAGKRALLIVGFTKDSQKQTEAWSKRVNAEFPELETWSLADLESVPRLIRPIVVRAIKGSIPASQHDHFAILSKGGKDLRGVVGYAAKDDAYVVLLAQDGQIVWNFHGPVTDSALADLRTRHLLP